MLLEQKNIKRIHLSTDCVFSGLKGMYKEDDIKDEKNIYGLSKNIGEIEDDKNLTFRMSIIGPEIKNNGTGLFNWFMMQKGKIKGYSNVYWTGIRTLELAKAIEVAINEDLKGLYHLVCNEKISKYELLCMIKEIFNKEDVIIEMDDSKICDKSMINSRKDFSFRVGNYRQMLSELKNWIYDNKELYKKYLYQ